jgi:hypothetical protein
VASELAGPGIDPEAIVSAAIVEPAGV